MKLSMMTMCVVAVLPCVHADDGYGPKGTQHSPSAYVTPPGMVAGGAFIDRILPMPVTNGLRSDVWGGDNVKPRNVDNGIEDPKWSYWCMSVHQENDHKYHMFATRWAEDDKRGHNAWPTSRVIHAVSEHPCGPFIFKQEVGPGHNVMCYRAKDGTYVLYVIGGAYTSKSPDGPWTKYDLKYDVRGTAPVAMSNHSFTRREDGSILMVSRAGHIWISEDGLKPFKKITSDSLYPKIPGQFEDPVVWRDEVQYHLIVNDWLGRTAFYLRSKDGVNWVWDQGKAYDIEIVRHPDGTKEGWHKFERPNVLQDEFGRATHLYLAVIDAPKDLDHGADNHSSKVIALPLTVQRRLEVIQSGEAAPGDVKMQVKIKAEAGFNPLVDVDRQSLMLGAPSMVDFGKGAKASKFEKSGNDLMVTFDEAGKGIQDADFVVKLLGKNAKGELLFGYARIPGRCEPSAILSPLAPSVDSSGKLSIKVENLGLVPSRATKLMVELNLAGGAPIHLSAPLPAIDPYREESCVIPLDQMKIAAGKPCQATVSFELQGQSTKFNILVSE